MNKIKLIILFLISITGLSSCASVGERGAYGVANTVPKGSPMLEHWFLIEINNKNYKGSKVTLNISQNSRVSGFSGCNRYFASMSIQNSNMLKINSVSSTRMLCADYDSNNLEKKYLSTLRDVTHFQRSVNSLVLQGRSGTLTFYKK